MSTIDIGYKDNYQVIEKTKVNDKKIYQLVIGKCKTYFYEKRPRGDFKYILLFRKVNKHFHYRLIGIYHDVDEMDPAYKELRENINVSDREVRQIIKKYDIKELDLDQFFRNREEECDTPFDLTRAHNLLDKLNDIIEEECNDLRLHLDYVYNMKNKVVSFSMAPPKYLLLCLYHKEDCISSIELIPKEKTLIINSITENIYEGKKYNKLLRTVALMIASVFIPSFTTLSSTAMNPVSVWLLVSTLNGEISEDNVLWYIFLKKKFGDNPYHISYGLIEEYYQEYDMGVTVNVKINEKNVVNAMNQFRQIVGVMGCERKPKRPSSSPKTRKSRSKSKSRSRSKSKSRSKSNSPK